MKQYKMGYPSERVVINIMGPLPLKSNNSRYLLVVSCYFTKWLDAISLSSIDAKTVANKLIERFISVFGVPLMFILIRAVPLIHRYFKKYALY